MNDDYDETPVGTDGLALPATPGGAPGASDGPGSGAVAPGFEVTRDELLNMARERYRQVLGVVSFERFRGADGRWRQVHVALDPAAEIEAAVVEDSMQPVMDGVYRELRRRLEDETWRVVSVGTEGEREARRRAAVAEADRLGDKARDPGAVAAPVGFLRAHPSHVYVDADLALWYLAEPPGTDQPGLVLRIFGAAGATVCVPGFVFDRPPGWAPPYGLP
jgi:hypothetical protein